MKIRLRNFRCHTDSKFEFPEKGLILLSGHSGAGKSTILNAIMYALYGKFRRPYTHGKTTCGVDLEIFDLKVSRTNRPNRLVVEYDGNSYEDDAAQGVVNSVLGMSADEFESSSYVVQRKNASILSMTPAEQLLFVEKVAFSDDKHTQYKALISETVKEKREIHLRLEGETRTLTRLVDELIPPIEPVKPEGSVKDAEEKIAHLKDLIGSSEAWLGSLREDLSKSKAEDAKIEQTASQIREIEIRISAASERKSKLEIPPKPDEILISKLMGEIQKLRKYEDFLGEKKMAKNYEEDHFETMRQSLRELEPFLIPPEKLAEMIAKRDSNSSGMKKVEYDIAVRQKESAKAEMMEIMDEMKKQYDMSPKIKQPAQVTKWMKDEIASVNEQLDILRKMKAKKYECPHCNGSVLLVDDSLVVAGDDHVEEAPDSIDEDIDRWQEVFNDISRNFDKYVDLNQIYNKALPPPVTEEEDIAVLSKKIAEAEQARETKAILEESQIPSSIKALKEKIAAKESEFIGYEPDPNSLQTLEQLQSQKKEYSRVMAEISTIDREISAMKSKMPKKVKKIHQPVSDIEKQIGEGLAVISESRKQLDSFAAITEYLSAKKSYDKEVKMQDTLKKQLKEATKNLSSSEAEFIASTEIAQLSKRAEVEAIEQTVESINTHAKVYLDQMFEDTLHLRLNIDTTRKQPAITVSCEYKGGEYSTIDDLSGGERQRCNLAYLLAVNDMIGSPMLLLDECLNNLNSEINTEILEYLKEVCSEKLVVVVSHEAVQGLFDDIIEVGV